MDTAPWPQDMLGLILKPNNMEETNNNSNNNTKPQQMAMERRLVRPQKEQALNCPRCNSTNTKFCYYNNYSLTQPRYFCKTCRRYWTEGGSLRNVPVGGGSRKNHHNPSPNNSNNNKRSSSASSSSTTASSSNSTTIISSKAKLVTHENRSQLITGAQDLNLDDFNAHSSSAADVPAAINPFVMMHPMAIPPTYPSSAFPPSDNVGNVNGGFMMQESAAMVLFPFEEARQFNIMGCSNNSNGNGGDHDQFEQNKGFWSGMMRGGGGGSW